MKIKFSNQSKYTYLLYIECMWITYSHDQMSTFFNLYNKDEGDKVSARNYNIVSNIVIIVLSIESLSLARMYPFYERRWTYIFHKENDDADSWVTKTWKLKIVVILSVNQC
jgi:hypothetical protein